MVATKKNGNPDTCGAATKNGQKKNILTIVVVYLRFALHLAKNGTGLYLGRYETP